VVSARNANFTEQVTGGNGRSFLPAQANTYYLQVPTGKPDLSIGVISARHSGTASWGYGSSWLSPATVTGPV
jgi:hypothetical protein